MFCLGDHSVCAHVRMLRRDLVISSVYVVGVVDRHRR